MKKLMAFFAAFLLVFAQGVAAFEQSPLSYATGGALQGNTIQNGEVQILSDAEMAEVEGEILPLALAVARLGYMGYKVYTAYDKAKKVTTITKVVNSAGKSVSGGLAESTTGRSVLNYSSNILKKSDIDNELIKQGYKKELSKDGSMHTYTKNVNGIIEKYGMR